MWTCRLVMFLYQLTLGLQWLPLCGFEITRNSSTSKLMKFNSDEEGDPEEVMNMVFDLQCKQPQTAYY